MFSRVGQFRLRWTVDVTDWVISFLKHSGMTPGFSETTTAVRLSNRIVTRAANRMTFRNDLSCACFWSTPSYPSSMSMRNHARLRSGSMHDSCGSLMDRGSSRFITACARATALGISASTSASE